MKNVFLLIFWISPFFLSPRRVAPKCNSVTTVSCCGDMLRECMEREALAKILLESERFFRMFDFIVLDSFDISSDAHRTFRVSCSSFEIYYKKVKS